MEARAELRPLLLASPERLKDLIFLDIALDSTVRTAVERSYEQLANAAPEVNLNIAMFLPIYQVRTCFVTLACLLSCHHFFEPENHVLHQSGS